MRKIKFIPLFLFLLCSIFAHAQSANQPVEMADGMRSNGKIYVVVGVLVIILFGLLAYLISIDKKVGRMEKSIEEGKK
jgi:CcmD family protein